MTRRDKFGRKRARKTTQRLPDLSLRELWHQGEYLLFFVLSTALFLLVGVVLLTFVASGGWLIGGLASVFLFVWVVSAVDFDAIKAFGGALWGSGSAEWLKARWDGLLPHRDRNRRGTTSVQALFVLGLLVCSLVVGTMGAGSAAATGTTATNCSTEVLHDTFRDNATIAEFNDSGVASSTKANTRVRIEETDAFYRVNAQNPNGYCVRFVIRVSQDIMLATERGQVDSSDGNVTAEWHDVTNFDQQTTYTEISFTAPPGSEVTFAPSKPAIVAPAWRDKQKREAEGVLDRVRNFSPFEDDTLEQREYEFSAPETNGSYVTFPLENESTNQSIEEWNAVYRLSEDDPWRPINKEADDPVFVREIDGGSKLQFVFNDRSAEVKLTANPDTSDKIRYDMRSLRSSIADLKNLNIF
jgi:hypothetical protein